MVDLPVIPRPKKRLSFFSKKRPSNLLPPPTPKRWKSFLGKHFIVVLMVVNEGTFGFIYLLLHLHWQWYVSTHISMNCFQKIYVMGAYACSCAVYFLLLTAILVSVAVGLREFPSIYSRKLYLLLMSLLACSVAFSVLAVTVPVIHSLPLPICSEDAETFYRRYFLLSVLSVCVHVCLVVGSSCFYVQNARLDVLTGKELGKAPRVYSITPPEFDGVAGRPLSVYSPRRTL